MSCRSACLRRRFPHVGPSAVYLTGLSTNVALLGQPDPLECVCHAQAAIRIRVTLQFRTSYPMEAFLVSTGVVALAEIGDKTQLLAFVLAARFKQPLPIIAGILCATIINHGLAAALGAWITTAFSPGWLRWLLGGSFVAMAIWTLLPDAIEDDATRLAGRIPMRLVPPADARTPGTARSLLMGAAHAAFVRENRRP